MRLERVRIRNLGPFPDFTADFTALGDAKLVAITGPNGAGKSTLLELALPGALYRETPTRGSLVDLATARDGMLESRVVNGRSWTIRHLVDKVSGKSEASVLDESGAPAIDSSKVRDFDRWAERHLPSPEVLYSCMFAPQGAGGFLAAKPAERKATLLRILGVERLEAQAEIAREHARATKTKLEVLTARIADERERSGDVDAARAELERAREASAKADADLVAAREALVRIEADVRAVEERWRVANEARAKFERLTNECGAAASRVADLDQRIKNNRAVLGEAKAIREAVATVQRLTDEIATSRGEAVEAESQVRQHAQAALDLDARLRAVVVRIERADELLAGREAVTRAAERLPALESAAKAARDALTAAEAELERVQGQHVAGAEDRIRDLRTGLFAVEKQSKTIAVARGVAREALAGDDAAVERAKAAPLALKLAREAVQSARDRAAVAEREHADARVTADRARLVEAAAQERSAASEDRLQLEAERESALTQERGATNRAHGLRAKVAELETELAKVKPIAAKADPLARAETRVAELEPQLDAARMDRDRLSRELDELADPETPPAVPSTREARAAIEAAEAGSRSAVAAVAGAEQRLSVAEAAGGRLAELDAERAGVEAELADWTRLAQDLGRDGLQAAEIDAAGPELTEIVNDLLHQTHGPRFTVRIETQRLSADGKRQLEGCDVVVLDTEKGREAQGETFSGGERVIIGEAVSLALSMLACRRAGIERPTLVRDESGAALDPVNGRVYVAMLRRAAQIIGADRVLFVSHVPEVQEMADARIEVQP